MRKDVRKRTTSGRLLLLLGLLLQRLSDGFTHELRACLAHGSHCCVVGLIEANTNGLLTERFLALRDGVLMLSEVFY